MWSMSFYCFCLFLQQPVSGLGECMLHIGGEWHYERLLDCLEFRELYIGI